MALHEELIARIETKQAVIGVIGLGHVGLPLALAFANKKFRTIGFDTDAKKTKALMHGESRIGQIPAMQMKAAIASGFFTVRSEFEHVWECDAIFIAVPSLTGKTGEPDFRQIVATTESIAPFLRKGKLIAVESSAYAGVLEDIVVPILEQGGLKAGRDFFAAFSPKLCDSVVVDGSSETIPKIVGATSAEGLVVAERLYRQVFKSTVTVVATGNVGVQ
jgi:UDP-N-acetyl-D-glucosamine dehydrogenase